MKNPKYLLLPKRNQFQNNKVLLFVGVVVILNLYFFSLAVFYKTSNSFRDRTNSKKQPQGGANKMAENSFQLNQNSSHNSNQNSPKPKALNKEEIAHITAEIKTRNSQQLISNLDKFGEVNETTPVLLIQVHSRLENLKILINSLSNVSKIEHCLVIFSHDVFLPEMNDVIEQIDFVRVLQIFYPHSIQLHPNHFPGEGYNDCSKSISHQNAKKIQCENWKYPDMYGNYREAKFTQVKHHWWWKTNFVFSHVTPLENHRGLVVFLEEDQFASPDLLWTLNLMEVSMRENRCGGCSLLELGLLTPNIHDIRINDSTFYSKTTVTKSYFTFALAFNRTFWESIEKCTLEFCNYDDYNWDLSIKSVFRSCFTQPVLTLYTDFPRIFHNGKCNGLHKKDAPEGCDIYEAALNIGRTIGNLTELKLLFPETLGVAFDSHAVVGATPRSGGWGDIRDKKLCISFSKIFGDYSKFVVQR